ncbi:MAG: hypothetical protein CMF23_17790 [Ignavibacteriae bacterium]|nr:hypothetical protein [Ignavibacteriota bacterium]
MNKRFVYDPVQLVSGTYSIEFFFDLGYSTLETVYCLDNDIRLLDELKLKYDYDVDELITLLGTFRIKLLDNSYNNIFVKAALDKRIDYRTSQIFFRKGSSVIFHGYLDDESIEYNLREKEIVLEYKPKSYVLKEKKIWNDEGTFPSGIMELGWDSLNLNPLESGQKDLYHSKVHEVIERIFKIIQPTITVDFRPHSWRFGTTASNCNTALSSLYVLNYYLFGKYGEQFTWNFGNGLGLSPGEPENFMELLKFLSFEFGAISGMVSSNKAVFVELNSLTNPYEIPESEILDVVYKVDRPTIERLELNQANGTYNWSVIQNSNKKVFEFETMKKNIFGDIYRIRTGTNQYSNASYCRRTNESSGVLVREYFLPKYWKGFFFDGHRKRTDEIRIKNVEGFYVADLIKAYEYTYHPFSQEIDYIENEITLEGIIKT